MYAPIAFVAIVVVTVILIGVFRWQFGRSDALLERWATKNGCRIVNKEYRWFALGPFFWTTSGYQTVHRVTVENADGQRRSAWVRCGSWWLGLMSDRVEDRWDNT